MIGGWKISLDWGLLLCAPSYHVCSLVPGDIEDSTRQSTTMEAQNKHYTTYWMLQFMWDCGYRIYADQWVKRLFEVNSKWLGKKGTNNTKTGMEIKRTLLCSNTLETDGHRSGRQTLEMRVFHSMSSWVNDFIGCRWAVEHRTKVGLDEKNLWDAFIAVKFQYLYFHFILILCHIKSSQSIQCIMI